MVALAMYEKIISFQQYFFGLCGYWNISTATARVAPDLLKAPAILSDTTVRRSAVDQEDLKPYWNTEKNPTFLQVINNFIIYKLFKDFSNHRKKTNRVVVVFSCRPFPNILK